MVDELTPIYVVNIPREMENGKLYISKEFETAIHLCACGCGYATVTPFNKSYGWGLTEKDGKVSLYPSIGNQNFPCKSHYFVTDNRIIWC